MLSGIAQAITAGVRWIVANTATWWLRIPSPDLAAEPAVTRIQQWLLPITAAVAIGGVIAAGARMALTRRANPLLDVTGGLLTLAAASTLGVDGHRAAAQGRRRLVGVGAAGLHRRAFHPAADPGLLDLGGGAAPAVVLIFGTIAIVLSLVQAVLMLFRQAALVILAGVLPLAAAGSIAPMTRTWIRKVTAWMLALICYKPAAAAVYATAFTMIGSGGSPRTVLMGFVMLLLSVVMLPALMKFFTWTTGTIAGSAVAAASSSAPPRSARSRSAPCAPARVRAGRRRRTRPPTSTPSSAPRPGGGPPGGAPPGPGPDSPSGPGAGSPAGPGAGGPHGGWPGRRRRPSTRRASRCPAGCGLSRRHQASRAAPHRCRPAPPPLPLARQVDPLRPTAVRRPRRRPGPPVRQAVLGAAVTVAAEGAAQGARLATGAMDPGDRQ